MKRYTYKVVRSFDGGSYTEELQQAFTEGWKFVRASEYVPAFICNGTRRYGYIEYILAKETNTVVAQDT